MRLPWRSTSGFIDAFSLPGVPSRIMYPHLPDHTGRGPGLFDVFFQTQDLPMPPPRALSNRFARLMGACRGRHRLYRCNLAAPLHPEKGFLDPYVRGVSADGMGPHHPVAGDENRQGICPAHGAHGPGGPGPCHARGHLPVGHGVPVGNPGDGLEVLLGTFQGMEDAVRSQDPGHDRSLGTGSPT
jgi:hypothetical protein